MKQTYGDKLKHLRITSNFNQKEFSELLDVPQSSYSDIENSIASPKIDIQKKIISNFNLPQDYFLECYFEKKERKVSKIPKSRSKNLLRQNKKSTKDNTEDANKLTELVKKYEEKIATQNKKINKIQTEIELLTDIVKDINETIQGE